VNLQDARCNNKDNSLISVHLDSSHTALSFQGFISSFTLLLLKKTGSNLCFF